MFQDEDNVSLPLALKKRSKTGTLSKPSRTDAITSCSKVLHQHIWRAAQANRKPSTNQTVYDIDKFLKPQLTVRLPITSSLPFFSTFNQTPKEIIVPDLPDESKIFRFCKRVVDRCHLNAECVIIALIYIERLMENISISVSHRNWIPVLVVALLTASKVWDDHSTFNGDLCAFLPVFSITDINNLERQFLTDLKYMLHIPFSDYAKYYFGLRALKQSETRSIPKYYLRIGLGNARKVEQKSSAAAAANTEVNADEVKESMREAKFNPEPEFKGALSL